MKHLFSICIFALGLLFFTSCSQDNEVGSSDYLIGQWKTTKEIVTTLENDQKKSESTSYPGDDEALFLEFMPDRTFSMIQFKDGYSYLDEGSYAKVESRLVLSPNSADGAIVMHIRTLTPTNLVLVEEERAKDITVRQELYFDKVF